MLNNYMDLRRCNLATAQAAKITCAIYASKINLLAPFVIADSVWHQSYRCINVIAENQALAEISNGRADCGQDHIVISRQIVRCFQA